MSLAVTDPNSLSSLPTWTGIVTAIALTFFAISSSAAFSLRAFSPITRLACSTVFRLRPVASTALFRGRENCGHNQGQPQECPLCCRHLGRPLGESPSWLQLLVGRTADTTGARGESQRTAACDRGPASLE